MELVINQVVAMLQGDFSSRLIEDNLILAFSPTELDARPFFHFSSYSLSASLHHPHLVPLQAVNKSSSVRKKNSAIPQSSPQGSLKARGIAATITPDEKPKLKEGRKEGLKEEEKEKSGVVVEGDDNNGISDVSGDGKDGEENDGSSNW